MTRFLVLATAVALCACHSAAVPSPRVADPAIDAAGRDVIALERAIWDAEQRRDRHGVDTLMAPDYRYLSSIGGHDRTGVEDLDNRFGPHVTLEAYTLRSLRTVRVSDDVIALHFLADQRIRTDKGLICPRTGTSETWARRDERWLLVTRTEYLIGGERPPACEGAPAR